jgi:hypothetical protein
MYLLQLHCVAPFSTPGAVGGVLILPSMSHLCYNDDEITSSFNNCQPKNMSNPGPHATRHTYPACISLAKLDAGTRGTYQVRQTCIFLWLQLFLGSTVLGCCWPIKRNHLVLAI